MKKQVVNKCQNCGNEYTKNYCNSCGQKIFTANDKSIKHIFEEAFHFITHFEGSFFTTFKTVLFKPSKLTLDYCNGVRKKYFKPISFYLFLVVLYLLFPIFSGLNMEMGSYTSLPIIGKTVSHQIEQRTTQANITEDKLAEKFEHKSHSTSKILLLTLIPLTSFLLKMLYWRKNKDWYKNLILATEINIFYLLLFFLIFPIIYISILLLFRLNDLNDELIGTITTILFGIYTSVVFRNVFKSKRWVSIMKGFLFAFIHTFLIIYIYKILVFQLTFLLI